MTCEDYCDLLPLYITGALPPDDAAAVRAHLQTGCPLCKAALQDMEVTMNHLPNSLPPLAPPAGAWDKIESRIALQSEMAVGGGDASDRAALDRSTTRRRINWAALTGWAAAALVTLVLGLRLQNQQRELLSTQNDLANAKVLLAEMDTLKLRQLALEDALNTVTIANSRYFAQTQSLQERINRLMRSDAYAMKGDLQPNINAKLFWDKSDHTVTLIASNVAQLPPGKTYELWGITPDGAKIRVGIASPDPSGKLLLESKLPPAAQAMTTAAITDEPAGGTDAPTGQIQFLAALAKN